MLVHASNAISRASENSPTPLNNATANSPAQQNGNGCPINNHALSTFSALGETPTSPKKLELSPGACTRKESSCPIFTTTAFAELFSPEERVKRIQIYDSHNAAVVLKDDEQVVPSHLSTLPDLSPEKLKTYLEQSHFTVKKLPVGDFQVEALQGLKGGGRNWHKIHTYAWDGNVALMKETLSTKVPHRYHVDIPTPDALADKQSTANFEGDTQYTAFQLAWSRGNFEVVKLLAEAGADVNRKVWRGAFRKEWPNWPLVTAFWDHPTSRDDRKKLAESSALDIAFCDLKDKELSKVLIKAGANLTPRFMEAVCSQSDMSFLKYLHEILGDKVSDSEGSTPLHYAGNAAVIEYLLQKGYEIDSINNKGKTPLCVALECKKLLVAELLLKNGADQDKISNRSVKISYPAAANLDLKRKDERENSEATRALLARYPSSGSSSLNSNARSNTSRSSNTTANTNSSASSSSVLNNACKSGNLEVVKFTIRNGGIPDDETLIIACETGEPSIVQAILDLGVNANAKVIAAAKRTGNSQILKLLKIEATQEAPRTFNAAIASFCSGGESSSGNAIQKAIEARISPASDSLTVACQVNLKYEDYQKLLLLVLKAGAKSDANTFKAIRWEHSGKFLEESTLDVLFSSGLKPTQQEAAEIETKKMDLYFTNMEAYQFYDLLGQKIKQVLQN